MTGPGPIAEPPAEIAEIVGSAVQQLGLDPQAYGLTWRLRIATVISPSPLYARFDGDVTGDPLRIESLIGYVIPAARVYVITIPPSGNFAISYVDNPFAVDVETQTVLTAALMAVSVGPEVAIPTANYLSQPLFTFRAGCVYRLTLNYTLYSNSGAAASTNIRIRQGAQTTTGTQLCYMNKPLSANAVNAVESQNHIGYCKNSTSSDIRAYLSVTNALVVGAQSAIYADGNVPLILEKQLIGAVTAYADLAAVTVSLI